MNQPTPTDNESIPVSAARLMAFLTLGISVGFVLVLYFVFIQAVFSGAMALGVLAVMLAMSAFSVTVALQTLRKKMLCPQCHQPFFSRVGQLFLRPKRCVACGHSVNNTVIER